MSLRIPNAGAMPPSDAGDGQGPLPANPFAAGPGGFLNAQDLESKPSKFSGLLVLGMVVAVAGGVLFGMRQLGMGPKLSLAEIKIDYPLDSDPLNANSDHERILEDLRTGGNVQRVPLEMVQTNPFAWRSLAPKEVPEKKQESIEDLSRRQAEERRQKTRDAAAALVLNSMMGGRVPMARIDGQLVRVGDRVGEYFTVKAISGRSVELASEDEVFSISMNEPEDASHPGGPPRR